MESMPLFPDVPVPRSVPRSATVPQRDSGQNDRGSQSAAQRHLAAARRLAKAMRRLPDRSLEQTRAGQAICRHLIALLDESPQDSRREP